jgi:glycosyltransferase involved in cell wall biosynthesis
MEANPLISIIVPSFNQGKYIRETLESIFSQDYRPIEVLVFDGGSTDETLSILKSFDRNPELKSWSEPDEGVVDAVNKGLERALGDILSVQASDDVYLPGAFSAAADLMKTDEDLALVYGDVEYIDDQSQVVGRTHLPSFEINEYLGKFSYIPQPATFFRAAVAKQVGCWRHEVSYAADADYWLRIVVLKYKVVKLDRLMGRYRRHPNQRDRQFSNIRRDYEKTIDDLLANPALDKSQRRFARMGVHLTKHHYTPEYLWMQRTWHLYRALVANPLVVFDARFPKRELLIGREPIWTCLSRVKRQLGFRPRVS